MKKLLFFVMLLSSAKVVLPMDISTDTSAISTDTSADNSQYLQMTPEEISKLSVEDIRNIPSELASQFHLKQLTAFPSDPKNMKLLGTYIGWQNKLDENDPYYKLKRLELELKMATLDWGNLPEAPANFSEYINENSIKDKLARVKELLAVKRGGSLLTFRKEQEATKKIIYFEEFLTAYIKNEERLAKKRL